MAIELSAAEPAAKSISDKFVTVVLIATDEDAALNLAGYGARMPDDWDEFDDLDRNKAVGIKPVENAV